MISHAFFLSLWISAQSTKTILISADGFRWDYYGSFATPSLDRLVQSGFRAKNLINSYATVTFPNHYTLATGLYEESHGIIDNEMFDPDFNETFNMSTIDPKWWAGAEPIWITAEKNNIKTVCVNWVGCSVPHENAILPTYWNLYDGSIPYEARIDRIVEKLTNGGAQLGLLYFEDPDHTCHMFGPDSQELKKAVERIDSAIGYLLSKIDLREVNVIFTADHGGYSVSKERVVVLEEYSDVPFEVAASGAVAHVWPLNNDQIDEALMGFSQIEPTQASCYRKQDIPSRLHYSNNRRIAPIVCMAELGWSVVKSENDKARFHLRGSHGYDASLDEESPMRPIFIAAGPDLAKRDPSDPIEPFENVGIFALVATLIGIPEDNWPSTNSTLVFANNMLERPATMPTGWVEPILIGAAFTVGLGFMVMKQ